MVNRFLRTCQQGWRQPNWLSYLLLPITVVYMLVITIRKWFYRIGIFTSSSVTVPVIVVGGVSVGGSGKTPFVITLTNYFKANGYRPGVISRGYGGNNSSTTLISNNTSATESGDEALLIFKKCAVSVAIGRNKANSARCLQQQGCDIIISDDGLQHFALKRDIDIVVIDSEYGLRNRFCLPSGPLREPLHNIARAHYIICNGQYLDTLQTAVPLHSMKMTLQHLRSLDDKKTEPTSYLAGKQIHAVAALGNPQRFFQSLVEHGASVTQHPFRDHYKLIRQDLDFSDNKPIIITEKDAIKLTEHDLTQQLVDKLWVAVAVAEIPTVVFSEIHARLK